jgi:hypothetical protein
MINSGNLDKNGMPAGSNNYNNKNIYSQNCEGSSEQNTAFESSNQANANNN